MKRGLGWLFPAGFAVLLMFVGLELATEREPFLLAYEMNWKSHPPTRRAVIHALRAAEAASNDSSALARIERTVALLDSAPGLSDRVKARTYGFKAEVHWRLWQAVEAQAAWQRALTYARGAQRAYLKRRVAEAEVIIETVDAERGRDTVYIATPGVGPAAALQGRVLVLYVFLEDRDGHRWSPRQRHWALASWGTAERWLARGARAYGKTVEFSRRVFLVDRNPHIKQGRVDFADPSGGEEVARLVAQDLGFPDVLTFTERAQREGGADQAVLLIHVGRDSRSFASRCHRRCRSAGEFAFVLEAGGPKTWQRTEYAQAHETLHLFGADDLYDLKGAKHYATRDIMHYPSRIVSVSTLEPITAYAVKLRDDRVPAPFTIITFH